MFLPVFHSSYLILLSLIIHHSTSSCNDVFWHFILHFIFLCNIFVDPMLLNYFFFIFCTLELSNNLFFTQPFARLFSLTHFALLQIIFLHRRLLQFLSMHYLSRTPLTSLCMFILYKSGSFFSNALFLQ